MAESLKKLPAKSTCCFGAGTRNQKLHLFLLSWIVSNNEMTIPAEKLFIVAAEIDSKNKDIEINVSDLTMYDKQGADITEEII